MNQFYKDISKEKILGQYLSIQYANAKLNTDRNDRLDLQFKGIDIILKDQNEVQFKVDEKAQLHYLNKDLPTFALEINYIKDSKIKQGWLYDSSKITEIYAFIFSIYLFPDVKEMSKVEDIKSCDVVFVNRIRLINELALLEINIKTCQLISEQLRIDNSLKKINHKSGFNFQISTHLSEKPVNLIVKKSFLISIGEQLFFPLNKANI